MGSVSAVGSTKEQLYLVIVRLLPVCPSSFGEIAGELTGNRVVIQGGAVELGSETVSLLLDSGASTFILFSSEKNGFDKLARKEDLSVIDRGTSQSLSVSQLKVGFLSLQGKTLPRVSALLLHPHTPVDVDGIIPTAWFHSFFLCHSGRYIIFDPSFRTTSPEALH